jgi:hypothetical protein
MLWRSKIADKSDRLINNSTTNLAERSKFMGEYYAAKTSSILFQGSMWSLFVYVVEAGF